MHAAEAALADHHYVSAVDVFIGIGWLVPTHVQAWRRGLIPYLERVIHANLHKISHAMQIFQEWAGTRGLMPSETAYLARTRHGRWELRFSKSGHPRIEETYRTHYVSPKLSEQKRQKLREKVSRPPELVVFWTLRDSHCAQCKTLLPSGSFLLMEIDQPLCMTCAHLDHLVYVPRGDAALTRRAKQYSSLSAVVVRFSRTRKRYERQGILVEETALDTAKQEGRLASAERRTSRQERDALRRADEDTIASVVRAPVPRPL